MYRLKHCNMLANVCRTCQTNRTRDVCRTIGKDVTVKIWHHHYVESLRSVSQLRGANVNNPMLVLDFGIFLCNLVEDLMEESIRQLHDVVFSEARDFLPVVLSRVFKRIPNNLF